MAPSRPPLAKKSSFMQTILNSSFIPGSSHTTISISDSTHRTSKKPPAKSNCKTKPAGALASDRMLTDVLLSIKPVHLANIVTRRKNHKYRKYRLRDGVTRLWFYETGDGGRGRASITHIAVIPASIRHSPGSVPAKPFDIGNAEFNAGLKESKYGYPVLVLQVGPPSDASGDEEPMGDGWCAYGLAVR